MRRAWPVLLVGSTALVAVAAALGGASPARTLAVIWFIGVCPGMALVRGTRAADGWAGVALGTGLSLALGLLVAGALLYAGALSGAAVFGVLAAITLAGSAADLVRGP